MKAMELLFFTAMRKRGSAYQSVFAPVQWVLPGVGTNGYITSWGPNLSGTPAQSVDA